MTIPRRYRQPTGVLDAARMTFDAARIVVIPLGWNDSFRIRITRVDRLFNPSEIHPNDLLRWTLSRPGPCDGIRLPHECGRDYISSYSKLHLFQPAPDRMFVLLAAGNLATTQEVLNRIRHARDALSADRREQVRQAHPRSDRGAQPLSERRGTRVTSLAGRDGALQPERRATLRGRDLPERRPGPVAPPPARGALGGAGDNDPRLDRECPPCLLRPASLSVGAAGHGKRSRGRESASDAELNRARRGMRCLWMGSAPADVTTAGAGAVQEIKTRMPNPSRARQTVEHHWGCERRRAHVET